MSTAAPSISTPSAHQQRLLDVETENVFAAVHGILEAPIVSLRDAVSPWFDKVSKLRVCAKLAALFAEDKLSDNDDG
jgi:hypothetical protein